MTEIIKCVGINTNKLRQDDFHRLFIIECQALGTVARIGLSNQYAAAVVIPYNR